MLDRRDISIKINLVGITDRMQRVLRDAMNIVAIGLNAKKDIAAETLAIPGVTMQHQFAASQSWSIEEARDAWELWVIRNGFRDIAEELSSLLEEVQTVLAYWKIRLLQDSKSLRGEDWNEIVVRRSQQFHRRTLPQKLEFLEQKYSFTLDLILIHQAMTINAARNCLTHRGGIVTQIDVDTSGKFVLEWSALVLLAKIDGQEKEINVPYYAKAGTEILVGIRGKSKSFEIGQMVSVNTEEFTQVCWTLFKLATSCAQRLEAYGKERAFNFDSAV
ncbi:MAG: hypothetical protein U0V02_16510 [Anaerolineales bacterium]